MNPTGWHLELIGLAWWLILPLSALLGVGIVRLMGLEVFRLPRQTRRGLTWLRGAAVVIVALLLLEPTLTHTATDQQLPSVAVLIDHSGSMAVTDAQMPLAQRLDEAVALGLVDASIRPEGPRRARRELTALITDLPNLNAAVVAAQEAWAHGQQPPSREQGLRLADYHGGNAGELVTVVAGNAEAQTLFKDQAALMARVAALLKRERADQGEKPEVIAAALAGLTTRCRALLPKLDAAQEASDRELLAKGQAATVTEGLEKLRALSRYQRAMRLTRERLVPLFKDRAELAFYGIDDGSLTPLAVGADTSFAPTGPTDFAAPFSTLARGWADQKHVGGVLLLSDGRQTAGVDPIPAVRALMTRGARLAGVLVGDAGEIRDAVVAEVQAPAEVFRGETVRLDVRYRITGFKDQDWTLVLTQDGKAVDQRTVRGNGNWQTERFEVPNAQAGVHNFQARIERVGGPSVAGGGMLREVWNNLVGFEVRDLVQHPPFAAGRPDLTEVVAKAEVVDGHENYGERLRGFVLPPASGNYVFWLTGDDKAELWLSTSADPVGRVKLADVFEWVQPGEWDKAPSQHSQPVALEKGKTYYLEVLHKQSSGGGHVAVGWTLPDQRVERPISGTYLAPFSKAPPKAGATRGDDAEASLANNQADCSVTVNDDPLKVLVLDSSPRWESRFLVNMFERDKRVEVVRRYSSVRQPRGERELVPKTQEALDAFDLVVLGDLTPSELNAEDQQHLERFVSRRGGFVVCIGGPRGMPAAYALGGLASLLPVRIVAGSSDGAAVTVTMTKAGANHPIVSVLDDAALNQKLWPALPPLQGVVQGVTAKGGTDVLLEAQNDTHTPVVAVSRYGAGRVLWVGSPETWRWRDRLGERVHQTFWLQAVRWGLGVRLRGKDQRLQAALDRALIAPRESAELRVRARRADGTPAGGTVHASVQRLDDKGEPVPGTAHELDLAPVPDADALWHLTLDGLSEGRWRVTVTCPGTEIEALSEVRDLVVRAHQSQEGIELGADLANLSRLCAAGGFRADTLDQAVPLVRDLVQHLAPKRTEHRSTHSLWDNYGALLVVLGLLSLEWIWRKRVGLP